MMRLIAITRPCFFEGEHNAICSLIDRGWWRIHIRKPDADPASMARLLAAIPENYRHAISLHDHLHLADEYGLGGVHLNMRNPRPPLHWHGMVSRSCHSLEEVALYSRLDYLTLSPVFDSISKPGYKSRFDLSDLDPKSLHNVFALGGVTHSLLPQLSAAGFAGAAMLSEAWKTTDYMLQFITHTYDGLEDALIGGCRWVQLRMKDASDEQFQAMARRFIPLCRHYNATLIFDDRVHLAAGLGADGVHLGKNDMPLAEARKILGPSAIIGATANTADEVIAASLAGADYIGVGPLRFTTTKKNLAPLLGFDGYRDIMTRCRNQGMNLPVVAIGGITIDDIPRLKRAGVDGIAVSGLMLNSDDIRSTTEKIIYKWKNS